MALAQLEDDKDHQYERLIREVLKDFEGVQLLQFERTISLAGTEPEKSEQQGHALARQWLEDSGAHVLIWGLVLRQDGKSAPRLYWTTSQATKRSKEPYQAENFKLPDLFWNDLTEVLRLVVATYSSTFLAQYGRSISDQLTPFITRVRRLLDKRAGQHGWSDVQFVLGIALSVLGEETGTNKPLEEAVTAYRAALTEQSAERMPQQWAATQNNLGNALFRLGEREGGTARLEEAVTAYRAALTKRTRERVPQEWTITQSNLGNALFRLGERTLGTARLEEAVAVYHEVLEERTRERTPQEWAITQSNLGNALFRLGERTLGTARLEEAVAACREALKVWTRESVPLHWASTQNNLGNALSVLGEREGGTARLEEAVTAYHAALTVWTRESVPLHWASTQNNLGAVLRMLGERKRDATVICEALGKQLMAWQVFAVESPHSVIAASNNAKRTIAVLKNSFDGSIAETCIARHTEALKRVGLL